MFLQETGLNVVPGGIIPVMHVSQYDVGRELKFVLYDGYDTADITTGTTVTIEGTKPDGHGFQYSGVLDQNAHTATFVTTEQMTVLAGAIECKLTLYLNSQRIGTALFILDVEKAGINDSTIISDTELPLIIAQATEQMERAEAAADAAALSETNAATSETNAATSETNAANSEIICGSFMRMAGVSAASAEQSAIISGSFMRTAGNYADEAEASAANANVDALKSEGHALGTQNGTPVSSDSPYYHNNAKYWADEARQSSAGGVAASVIATAEPTNISTHAYAIGDQFVYNGILYTATSAISVGDTITPGTNCSISDTITEQIGNAGHTILDEDGNTYPQRSKLQFAGAIVSDDETNDATVVETVNPVEYEEDIYGVNLIPHPYYHTLPRISNGITFTLNDDYSITANGTATSNTVFGFMSKIDKSGKSTVPNGKYIVTGCPTGGSASTYCIRLAGTFNGSTEELGDDYGNGLELTLNGDDYSSDSVTLDVLAVIMSGTTVTNLTFRPMLRKANLKVDDYMPFNEQSIQNQITDQINVLSAKNMLIYPYVDISKTENGITFIDNGDGTVSVSGTATQDTYFFFNDKGHTKKFDRLAGKNVILSGCPKGGGLGTYYWQYWNRTTSNRIRDFGDGGIGIVDVNEPANWNFVIVITAGNTINNLTFKPMLRLASDPDNTYVPYAMTNRELTEVVDISSSVSVDSSLTAYTISSYTVLRCGKMISIDINYKSLTEDEYPNGRSWIPALRGLPVPKKEITLVVMAQTGNKQSSIFIPTNASLQIRGGTINEVYFAHIVYLTK